MNRSRIQATLVASFNWHVELKGFRKNLETIKHRIPVDVYTYLASCQSREDILIAISKNIGNKYIVELDWLYRTINIQTTVGRVLEHDLA